MLAAFCQKNTTWGTNMRNFQLILSAVLIACGASAFAQNLDDDNGNIGGSICESGQYCPPPSFPGDIGGGGTTGGNGGSPIDPSPYDPQPNYPDRPERPGRPPGAIDHREVYIGQYFRDQNIDILRTVGISPYNNRGAVIHSVEITTEPGNMYSQMELIADGRVEDRTHEVGYSNTLQPRRQLVLGQNFSNLFLGVRGKVFIRTLAVNLVSNYQPNPPPYPGPGYPGNPGNSIVARGYINQTFYGPGNVDIMRAVNLNNYRGYQISSITVYGRALNGQGSARILINGMVQGQIYLGNGGRQTVSPQGSFVVGRNVNGMNMLVDGAAQIDSVEVQLVRF
jgi:hypothetical protein